MDAPSEGAAGQADTEGEDAAFGRDLGEPDRLEEVRVQVRGDHAAATIRYRDLEIEAALPAQLPPWIDRGWLEPSSDR